MKFYNPFKISEQRLTRIEGRLDTHADILEEYENELVELKSQISDLQVVNEALVIRIESVENKQTSLRDGLKVLANDTPFVLPLDLSSSVLTSDMPNIDHVHLDSDFNRCPPDICIYCYPELKNTQQ